MTPPPSHPSLRLLCRKPLSSLPLQDLQHDFMGTVRTGLSDTLDGAPRKRGASSRISPRGRNWMVDETLLCSSGHRCIYVRCARLLVNPYVHSFAHIISIIGITSIIMLSSMKKLPAWGGRNTPQSIHDNENQPSTTRGDGGRGG